MCEDPVALSNVVRKFVVSLRDIVLVKVNPGWLPSIIMPFTAQFMWVTPSAVQLNSQTSPTDTFVEVGTQMNLTLVSSTQTEQIESTSDSCIIYTHQVSAQQQ